VSLESNIDFIKTYLEYTRETECPTFFHRWTAVTSLAAYLGRQVYFNHGHFTLYPNMYTMLIGSPGTKKSSGIKIGAKLLKQAGYHTFAAKKTRQEKFLGDLAEQSMRQSSMSMLEEDILNTNIFGDAHVIDEAEQYINRPPAECFVAADEFNNFIGIGNMDFISILGELWDYEGVYDYKLKNSDSIYIPHPTVTILGGNTPTGFAQAFPADTIGQGFFSRLLLIYGEPSGVKYTFPPSPNLILQKQLVDMLHKIKSEIRGELAMSKEAELLLDKIYREWKGVQDLRFEHYANRRLTHLIKLCLVLTASRLGKSIEVEDVIYANTLLTFTEQLMPKALGEFGKARNSDVTHKIMTAVDNATVPLKVLDLWKVVHTDLETREQLINIITNLQGADKLQYIPEFTGYLPVKKVISEGVEGAIDWSLLSETERRLE